MLSLSSSLLLLFFFFFFSFSLSHSLSPHFLCFCVRACVSEFCPFVVDGVLGCEQLPGYISSQRQLRKEQRFPWRDEEIDALRRGMVKHPPFMKNGKPIMQWAAIRNDLELKDLFDESRTGVDLKVRLACQVCTVLQFHDAVVARCCSCTVTHAVRPVIRAR